MADSAYEILVKIHSDVAGLRNGVTGVQDLNKELLETTQRSTKARAALNGFFQQIKSGFMMSIGFGAARMGPQFLRSLFPSPAEIMAEGSRIDQARRRLMLDTAEGFQVFARAMEDAGGDQGTMERGFNNLRRAVVRAAQGNETYARSLDGIGLSARDLLTLSLEEQFEAVAVGIMNAEDQTAALDATTRIFGERAGPALREIIEELGQNGLAGMTERVREQFGLMTTEQVQNLRQMEDNINQLRSRMRVSMAELIANPENMEAVESIVDGLEKMAGWMFNIARWSADFARYLGVAAATAVDDPKGAVAASIDNDVVRNVFPAVGAALNIWEFWQGSSPAQPYWNRANENYFDISEPLMPELKRRDTAGREGLDGLPQLQEMRAFEMTEIELGRLRARQAQLALDPFILEIDRRAEVLDLMRQEIPLLERLIEKREAEAEARLREASLAESDVDAGQLFEQYKAAAAEAEAFRLQLVEVNAEVERGRDFASEFRAEIIAWANSLGTEAEMTAGIVTGSLGVAVDGISSGLARAAMEGKGFGDAMRDALRSTIQWIIQATIRMALLRAVMGAVGGVFGESAGAATPTVMGHADGGLITGPGGPRDDSILARLSNGEFVMPAHVVRSVGASALESIRVSGRLPAFADGGLVGGGAQLASAGGGGGGVIVHQSIEVSTGVQPTVRAEILNLLPRIKRETAAAVEDARRRRVEMKYD